MDCSEKVYGEILGVVGGGIPLIRSNQEGNWNRTSIMGIAKALEEVNQLTCQKCGLEWTIDSLLGPGCVLFQYD